MPADTEKKKSKKAATKWTRTTVLIRDDHLEKFKILAWWEKSTIKDLFDEMVEMYLSSKCHLDHLIEEREKNLISMIDKANKKQRDDSSD